jgi:hypothetical protein
MSLPLNLVSNNNIDLSHHQWNVPNEEALIDIHLWNIFEPILNPYVKNAMLIIELELTNRCG